MTASLTSLPSESDVDSFGQAGLRFATGVSVITLGTGEKVHGATVSAVTMLARGQEGLALHRGAIEEPA